jgi:hypothetical protein
VQLWAGDAAAALRTVLAANALTADFVNMSIAAGAAASQSQRLPLTSIAVPALDTAARSREFVRPPALRLHSGWYQRMAAVDPDRRSGWPPSSSFLLCRIWDSTALYMGCCREGRVAGGGGGVCSAA